MLLLMPQYDVLPRKGRVHGRGPLIQDCVRNAGLLRAERLEPG